MKETNSSFLLMLYCHNFELKGTKMAAVLYKKNNFKVGDRDPLGCSEHPPSFFVPWWLPPSSKMSIVTIWSLYSPQVVVCSILACVVVSSPVHGGYGQPRCHTVYVTVNKTTYQERSHTPTLLLLLPAPGAPLATSSSALPPTSNSATLSMNRLVPLLHHGDQISKSCPSPTWRPKGNLEVIWKACNTYHVFAQNIAFRLGGPMGTIERLMVTEVWVPRFARQLTRRCVKQWAHSSAQPPTPPPKRRCAAQWRRRSARQSTWLNTSSSVRQCKSRSATQCRRSSARLYRSRSARQCRRQWRRHSAQARRRSSVKRSTRSSARPPTRSSVPVFQPTVDRNAPLSMSRWSSFSFWCSLVITKYYNREALHIFLIPFLLN